MDSASDTLSPETDGFIWRKTSKVRYVGTSRGLGNAVKNFKKGTTQHRYRRRMSH